MTTAIIFDVIGEPEAETWKDIPGYDDGLYQASNLGRIRRGDRILKGSGKRYPKVELCGKSQSVHLCVALAFIGPKPGDGYQVNHKNGIKADNRPDNLEWVTARENYLHAINTGLAPLGDRNGSRTKPESRPRGDSSAVAKIG